MRPGLSYILSLAATLTISTSALAEGTIFDLPPSQNYLINYSIDFLKKNPQYDSLSNFREGFAVEIRSSKDKEALFSSVNKALLQISSETLSGVTTYLKTGKYGDYERSFIDSDTFRLMAMIRDRRLQNMSEPSFLITGVVGIVMTQLHALSNEEYAKYSNNFIETIRVTQAELAQINSISQEAFIRDQIESNRDLLSSVPKDRISKVLESLKSSATRKFLENSQANVTAAAHLLNELVKTSVDSVNAKTLDATILKTQRVRVLELMVRALSETDAFTKDQRAEIAQGAKQYTSSDFDSISNKALQTAFKEAYLSKEVQDLTLKVKSL